MLPQHLCKALNADHGVPCSGQMYFPPSWFPYHLDCCTHQPSGLNFPGSPQNSSNKPIPASHVTLGALHALLTTKLASHILYWGPLSSHMQPCMAKHTMQRPPSPSLVTCTHRSHVTNTLLWLTLIFPMLSVTCLASSHYLGQASFTHNGIKREARRATQAHICEPEINTFKSKYFKRNFLIDKWIHCFTGKVDG